MLFAILCIGCYLLGAALIIHTRNFASALFFKVIPFFSGLFLVFYAAKTLGWLS
jgi:hypothetical protein